MIRTSGKTPDIPLTPQGDAVSVVRRARAGWRPRPDHQVADLAAQAGRLLAAGDGVAAWLLAERLVRLRRGLIADDLVLRGLTLAACGDAAAARRDVDAARQIDPAHPVANRLLLASRDAAERQDAARRLLEAGHSRPLLQAALAVLAGGGLQAVGSIDAVPGGMRGWIAWQGDSTCRWRLTGEAGDVEQCVDSQPGHPLAGAFAHAADLDWPWPDGADWVAVACVGRQAVLRSDRLWRADLVPIPLAPPASAAPANGWKVAVIVPVYDDLVATRQCLEALISRPDSAVARRIIVIDDATPDPRIAGYLDDLARRGAVELVRHAVNLGFAAAVNRGLGMLAPDEDALLLNADTLPPPDVCCRLARVAYARPDIGSVTPLSNNGEYTSLPLRFQANPMPSEDEVAALDRLAAHAMAGVEPVDLPNGIGFCLFVKRAVLEAVGPLSLQFGRGYGEDIEFCLRVRQAGFRHVCTPDVFVAHAGSRSFRAEKRALVVQNLARIDRLFPDYRRESAAFVRSDPLRAALGVLEWRWLVEGRRQLTIVFCAQEHDSAVAERYALDQRSLGTETVIAVVEETARRLRVRLRASGGGMPQNVVLDYAPDATCRRLTDDLGHLCLARLAIMDPASLPAALVAALTGLGIECDMVLAGGLGFDQAPGRGSVLRADLRDTLLRARHRVLAATRRLRHATAGQSQELAARIEVLPDPPAAAAAMRVARDSGARDWLVVADDTSSDSAELLGLLVTHLDRVDQDSGLIVDGVIADELAAMAAGNVLVLGRGPGDRSSSMQCQATVSAVLFLSQRRGIGDPRVDQLLARRVPLAYFDPSLARSRRAGRHLILSPDEPASVLVSQLLGWWTDLVRPAS